MHEVGSTFAPGCGSILRPSHSLTHSRTDGLTYSDACNDFRSEDFRSQAALCRRIRQCRGTQIPGVQICRGQSGAIAIARYGFQAFAFGRAAVAPSHRSAFVRLLVRDARRDAHDPALASGVVRQPLAPPVSHASRRGGQRLRAWRLDRLGLAQCVDRILGGYSISRGINY